MYNKQVVIIDYTYKEKINMKHFLILIFEFIRSIAFDLCFYIGAIAYLIFFFPFLPFVSRKFVYRLFSFWTSCVFFLLKHIVGLSFKVEGIENLDRNFCIIACKHQSVWETIVFSVLLDDFYLVLKKELLSIPIYGRYLKKLDSIVIDRSKGASSLKNLFNQIKKIKDKNVPILIFPEGRRMDPTIRQEEYKPGISFVYKHLNCKVCPAALNSGCFWKRKAFIKRPGTITIKFLKPIEPFNPNFMAELNKNLEDETQNLVSKL